MGYASVKKPAFYIPFLDYSHSIGEIKNVEFTYQQWDTAVPYEKISSSHLLNPTNYMKIPWEDTGGEFNNEGLMYTLEFEVSVPTEDLVDENGDIFIYALGHNFHTLDVAFTVRFWEFDGTQIPTSQRESLVNDSESEFTAPSFNGWSAYKTQQEEGWSINKITFEILFGGFDNGNGENPSFVNETDIIIGSWGIYSKWTPPHNPDLSIKMNRIFDGVNTVTTKGGSTLTQTNYTQPARWGTANAWQLTTNSYPADLLPQSQGMLNRDGTLGRKTWDMKFSYLTKDDFMPKLEAMNSYESEYYDTEEEDSAKLQRNQSFLGRVLNRVQGGRLPFIFQPNITDPNNNPDQFSIVRFDQQTFSAEQLAPDLYAISLKLKETW